MAIEYLDADGLRRRLKEAVDAAGHVEDFAAENGLSASHVYNVMRGDRPPGHRILAALGLVKTVMFVSHVGGEP